MELEGSDAKEPIRKHRRNSTDCEAISPIKCSRFSPARWRLIQALAYFLLFIFTCASLYGVLEEDILPGSELFALLLLAISAHIFGVFVGYLRLPPLIGMLITGFLFRNLSFLTFYDNISIRWATTLRSSAFVVILLKAGLGLDAGKLKELSRIVFQLAASPCIVETLAAAVSSHYFLDLPWTWAVMLGFVISAVSPAVIVPGLLNLQSRFIGTSKGIPTLVIAAASIDDIIAITGFSVMLSVSFSEGSLLVTILKGILEPIGGLLLGTFFGRIFWNLPSYTTPSHTMVYFRVLLLCFGGFAFTFLSKRCNVAGVGPMACLVLAFVAALGWKKDWQHFEKIENITGSLWTVLQPFLFSLIGSEVSVANLQINLGNTVLALFVALVFRILAATCATFGSNLNLREKVFVAFAWIPKATVQAAVGPQALDYVLSNEKGPEMEKYAQVVLTSAVVAIVMTAPVGAALIAILGPLLLSHDEHEREQGTEVKRLQGTDSEIL